MIDFFRNASFKPKIFKSNGICRVLRAQEMIFFELVLFGAHEVEYVKNFSLFCNKNPQK